MTRIPWESRKPPNPEDLEDLAQAKARLKAERKATEAASRRQRNLDKQKLEPQKKARINRRSRKRVVRTEEYLVLIDINKEHSPLCAGGCGGPNLEFHHICRGPNRDKTLTNMDLGMGGCGECHDKWDDKGEYPVERQLAVKFRHIMRQYEDVTGKRLRPEELLEYLKEMV
jgi:hypothetical protein